MRSGAVARKSVRPIEGYLLEKTHRLFGPVPRLAGAVAPEVIHQMRVNSRRLRVGLRFFQRLFPAAELRQVLRQLRRTTRALGAVRTLDVNAQCIRRAGGAGGAMLAARWQADRAEALAAARELLGMLRASQFPARVETMIRAARWPGEGQLRQAAAEQLRELRQELKKRYRQYRREQSSHRFHQFRIAVKHYRYGLEAAAAAGLGGHLRSRIRAVEELQDLMGAVHDFEVARAYVRSVRGPAAMIDWLDTEQEKRYELFKAFLKKERLWMKKVKQ